LDTSRLLIAIILSLGLIFAYQELVLKKMYPPPTKGEAQKPTTPMTASPAAGAAPSVAAGTPVQPAVSTAALPGAAAGPERLITVDTDLYRAVFTTRGGRLKSLLLKRFHETSKPGSPLYEMVQPSASGRLPLGVVVKTDTVEADDHELNYTTDSPDKVEVRGSEQATVTFKSQTSDGVSIEKTFTLNNQRYAFGMAVSVSGSPAGVGLAMTQPLTERGEGYYDIPQLQADVQDKVYDEGEKALRKGVAPVAGKIVFAGFGDRYFLSAYLPQSPANGRLSMEFVGTDARARMMFSNTSKVDSLVYFGPKTLEALESINGALTKSINFGWTGIVALPFLRILKVLHRFAGNWGWDIILMTIGVRLLTLPMSVKSQRSALKMQRLQPQMERLRTQFKDDQERLNKEMVDLYKRNHVNPLGGCAPMIIQFPIFIGLYEALLNAVELRHAPFMWWITDLSAPDCYPIAGIPKLPYIHCQGIPVLVLLMGVSAFLQQWMTPTQPDPNQQRMMMLSPLLFTVFLINFPAGLSLYYFASNVLGVIQQYFLNREFKQAAPVT
jgi:YidC/Oxa1 family membrane protein insertase